jgi:hypothetical protein
MLFGPGRRHLEVAATSENEAVDSVRRVAVAPADVVAGVAIGIGLIQEMSQNGEEEYKQRCET